MQYFIIFMTALGVLLPVYLDWNMNRLLREAEHPGKSNHPLVKSMVNKFTACYKLKIVVNSVDNFVDKYVYSYKIGGLYLSTWEKLCGQPVRCLGIISVAALFYSYFGKSGQLSWLSTLWSNNLSTLWAGVGITVFLIPYNGLFNPETKRKIFSSEMKDYLENTLRSRLEQEYVYPGLQKDEMEDGEKLQKPKTVSEGLEELAASRIPHPALCREEEIIEEILQEYFT